MKTRRLGKTDLTVTPLGLGLAALGRPGYITLGHAADLDHDYDVARMAAQTQAVLDAAWAAGIRYFDAARSYGRAEQFLGGWLQERKIRPEAVTIGSKWGYRYTAEWQVTVARGSQHEVKEHSLSNLEGQLTESRENLGKYLKLYQIHSATLDSGVMDNQPVLAKLADYRNDGLFIGFSVSGPGQADTIWRALEIQMDGKPLFSTVQATWNILEPSATAALKAAHESGMGVIIKEALANGRLTGRNQEPAFQPTKARLEQLAQTQGCSLDALALAAVINQPFVDVTLSGAAQIDHLHSNLTSLRVNWNEGLEHELAALSETADGYWQTRSRLAWN